ncbi:MAG: asparagine synthase (glutamine-hydrolyzing) [Flavobacteriales bacterium]|nr:asparagine synthase (glutamine-hydrolyzing) [Flavobacteriales bacterium]
MCGIGGVFSKELLLDIQPLQRMSNALKHRGPDDEGLYLSENKKAGLIHRRLSFIDLSPAGHQPMCSDDASIHVVLNGEIYNFRQLRKELQAHGCIFKTQTDTEVLIHGYKIWGKRLPEKLSGMFAFALFDENNGKLFLCRDRFGIKPLYYSLNSSMFLFASELKGILATSYLKKDINAAAISWFLANRYIPSPHTIWKNILKLPAAHFLELNLNDFTYSLQRYYTPKVDNLVLNSKEAFESFYHLLLQSLSQHLIADVPIGSFLSGGLDSSSLVLLMQKSLNYPTHAFSIGFKDWNESEHQYAEMVAQAAGAMWHAEILDKIQLDQVKKLMWHYDDPIADISILPTYAVSELARRHVKAVVSGEGADEILGGYWWHKPQHFYYASVLQKWLRKIKKLDFKQIKQHYIHAMSMGLFSRNELKQCLSSEFLKNIPDDPFEHLDTYRYDGLPVLKQIQLLDLHTFMNELILTKMDRASMAHSLEVRVPFLDHALVDFMLSLHPNVYFKPSDQKPFLKSVLKNHVPDIILNRPKQGFVGPDKFYMNYQLYSNTLMNGLIINHGVINKSYLQTCIEIKDHWKLWKLFVLENWWQVWME